MQEIRPRSRPSSCNLIVVVCECRRETQVHGKHWGTQRSFSLPSFGSSRRRGRSIVRASADFTFDLRLVHHLHTSLSTHTMAPVQFWSTPLTYLHWAARRKPAIFWSFIVGGMGPITVVRGAPLRLSPPTMHAWRTEMYTNRTIAHRSFNSRILWRWTTKSDSLDIPE